MAIKGYNEHTKKDDIKCLISIAVIFACVFWYFCPPDNKIGHIKYWTYNALSTFKNKDSDYNYYRNQAIYLANLNKKEASYKQINEAIKIASGDASDSDLEELYKVRGKIKIYFKDYKSALNDYLKANTYDITEMLTISQLYKLNGNKKEALSACNGIINMYEKAYAGFACLADVYANVGRYDVAVKVYDLYLDKTNISARGLADRAYYKKKMGDFEGAKADLEAAKNINAQTSEKITILDDTLKIKHLDLPIL